MRPLDLRGQRFGRLLVQSKTRKRNQSAWVCRCDCGIVLTVIQSYLRCGDTQSCGCLQVDRVREKLTKHGEAPIRNQSREYIRWQHAKQRCYNPNTKKFSDYGGRGITMCQEWRDDFSSFLKDMGRCPPGHSLGRIDNNGPYAPHNCRWETLIDQQNNTRRNRIITLGSITRTLTQWSRITGLPIGIIQYRLDKRGWSIEKTLTTPVR